MVVDGDVGNADALHDFGVLTVAGQIQQGGLCVATGGGEKSCNENGCEREVSAHGGASRGLIFEDEEWTWI
jgi:hypothetical protein